VDILTTFFTDHLYEVADDNAPSAEVSRVASAATRFVLFKVGQIRFALASTAIAAFGREREKECFYVAAQVLVPARYRAAATSDEEHQHYIHLAGTRLGIGPCKSDGEIVALEGAVAPRNRHADEPWIIATLSDPPSLILEKHALNTLLHDQAGT
jgi:hypothetical protein